MYLIKSNSEIDFCRIVFYLIIELKMTRAKGQLLFPHITKNIQNAQIGIKDKKEKNLLQRQPRVEITPSKENGINGSPALEHMISSDNHMIASVSTTTETSTGECNLEWEDERKFGLGLYVT